MRESKAYKRLVEIGGLLIAIRTVIDIINIPKDFAEGGDYIIDNIKLILISTTLIGFLILGYLIPSNKIKKTYTFVRESLNIKKNNIVENKIILPVIDNGSSKKLRRNPFLFIGIVSILISISAVGIVSYKYLSKKTVYYAQIDSAISHQEAVNKVVELNKILKSKNETYLHVRALQTINNTYMITIRRGYMAKSNAEKALKRAEVLLNDNSNDNRIYATDNINWRKKLIYMFQ